LARGPAGTGVPAVDRLYGVTVNAINFIAPSPSALPTTWTVSAAGSGTTLPGDARLHRKQASAFHIITALHISSPCCVPSCIASILGGSVCASVHPCIHPWRLSMRTAMSVALPCARRPWHTACLAIALLRHIRAILFLRVKLDLGITPHGIMKPVLMKSWNRFLCRPSHLALALPIGSWTSRPCLLQAPPHPQWCQQTLVSYCLYLHGAGNIHLHSWFRDNNCAALEW
jgi:hypothetical protein